ncbi:hypothetical protein [Nonomuraea sp. NPDC003804]
MSVVTVTVADSAVAESMVMVTPLAFTDWTGSRLPRSRSRT